MKTGFMKTSNEILGKAIELVDTIELQEKQLREINKKLASIYGDFSPQMPLCAEKLQTQLVFLLDSILGEELASYYLYERPLCGINGGRIIETDGTEWPITTLDELKEYCEHIRTAQ